MPFCHKAIGQVSPQTQSYRDWQGCHLLQQLKHDFCEVEEDEDDVVTDWGSRLQMPPRPGLLRPGLPGPGLPGPGLPGPGLPGPGLPGPGPTK